jgi:hypothetical protein
MESTVRPPTPLRSDVEISKSPSIDHCQVVAKIFVKFVSRQSSVAAYKPSYRGDSLSSILRVNTHFSIPLVRYQDTWNEYPDFKFSKFLQNLSCFLSVQHKLGSQTLDIMYIDRDVRVDNVTNTWRIKLLIVKNPINTEIRRTVRWAFLVPIQGKISFSNVWLHQYFFICDRAETSEKWKFVKLCDYSEIKVEGKRYWFLRTSDRKKFQESQGTEKIIWTNDTHLILQRDNEKENRVYSFSELLGVRSLSTMRYSVVLW